MENENINNLLLNAISSVQEKNNKNKEKIEVLNKTAKVINYDETNYTATVYMIDDQEQNEYILYNKSGEILSENDSVRVFYTTSVSKGWIGMRLGEPVVKEFEYIPYVSKKIYNTIESELGVEDEVVFSVDFNVRSEESDIVLSANQILNVTTDGIISFKYSVDGGQQETMPQQKLTLGKNIIPHIISTHLTEGKHNIVLKMSSSDARGLTPEGNFYGAISGMINDILIVMPPNYKFKFSLAGIPDNYSLTIPPLNVSLATIGSIDWGDGVIENCISNAESTHTYTTSGNYIIKITTPITEIYNENEALFILNPYIISAVFPDTLLQIRSIYLFNQCSNLSQVNLGKSLTSLTLYSGFYECLSLHYISLPNTLTSIQGLRCIYRTGLYEILLPESLNTFYSSNGIFPFNYYLSKAIINTNVLNVYMFTGCTALSQVNFNSKPTTIPTSCFEKCTSLSSIIIPSSVKTIGASAFKDTSLTSVTIASDCVYQANSFPSGCVINYY